MLKHVNFLLSSYDFGQNIIEKGKIQPMLHDYFSLHENIRRFYFLLHLSTCYISKSNHPLFIIFTVLRSCSTHEVGTR